MRASPWKARQADLRECVRFSWGEDIAREGRAENDFDFKERNEELEPQIAENVAKFLEMWALSSGP
jgi:hypothetical protein